MATDVALSSPRDGGVFRRLLKRRFVTGDEPSCSRGRACVASPGTLGFRPLRSRRPGYVVADPVVRLDAAAGSAGCGLGHRGHPSPLGSDRLRGATGVGRGLFALGPGGGDRAGARGDGRVSPCAGVGGGATASGSPPPRGADAGRARDVEACRDPGAQRADAGPKGVVGSVAAGERRPADRAYDALPASCSSCSRSTRGITARPTCRPRRGR